MELINKADLLYFAFNRKMPESRIDDYVISAVQVKHIMPILGREFYNEVIASPDSYIELVGLIKPIITQYVKFYILPLIFVEISNTGLNKVPGENRTSGTTEDLGSMRQNALDMANLYISALNKYLYDNSNNYPKYYRGVYDRYEIAGGIICENDFEEELD